MMKKRGIVRKDVRLIRQMNKSNTGEIKLPGNIQRKWRRKGMRAINAQWAMEKQKMKQGQDRKGEKLKNLEGRSDNRGRK